MLEQQNKKLIYFFLITIYFFYFYEFFLRVFPSLLVNEMMREFSVTATSIGIMSAFYIFAYAPMQIPTGLLLDKFDSKKMLFLAGILCCFGSIIFGFSLNIFQASVSRFLIGLGSSFVFIIMLYIITNFFDCKYHALLIGIGNAVGTLGAIIGQGPTDLFIKKFGWRFCSIYIFGGVSFLISCIMLFIMFKKNKQNRITHSSKDLFLNLLAIIKNKQSWIITIIGSSLYITISAFAILWSVPFLTKIYNSEKIAAFASSTIFVGSFIGGIFTGFFVNKIGSRKSFIKYLSIITFFLMLFLIFFGKYFPKINFIILFFIGAFTTVQLFSYTLIVDANDMKKKGTAIAFTIFFVWLAGAISQPLVGKILDLVSRHNIYIDEKSFYTLGNFQIAMLIFPLSYLVAFIFSFFIKEKKFNKKKLA